MSTSGKTPHHPRFVTDLHERVHIVYSAMTVVKR